MVGVPNCIVQRVVYLLRLENNIHPLLGIVAGFLIASGSNWWHLSLLLVCFVAMHSIVTLWNDIEDEAVDQKNGRHDIELLRKQHKLWMVWLMLVMLGIVVLSCLVYLPVAAWILVAIFLLLSWLYNAKPVQASRRPIGSMVIMWLTLGVVPVSMGVSLGQINVVAVGFVLLWSILRLSLSLLKDFKDAKGDAQSHKRTFLLTYGKTMVVRCSLVLAIVGVVGVIAMVYIATQSMYIVLPFAAGSLLLLERVKMNVLQQYSELQQAFIYALKLQSVFDGMVVICLSTLVLSLSTF